MKEKSVRTSVKVMQEVLTRFNKSCKDLRTAEMNLRDAKTENHCNIETAVLIAMNPDCEPCGRLIKARLKYLNALENAKRAFASDISSICGECPEK